MNPAAAPHSALRLPASAVEDTPDRLSYTKMAHFTHYVERLTASLDHRALNHAHLKEQTYETVALESRHLRTAFGMLHPLLLRIAGIRKVTSRSDMDAVALALRGLAG